MIAVLRNATYARLFAAQVIALLGTGLLTVALALLAYDLAGERAGAVLGTALAIKMLAYVGLSPLTTALSERLPRRRVLIASDLIRAAVALSLPFIDAVWQIYLLVFVLQTASATFTPTFQATIPDLFEDEEDYTRALSLSRLAYELENLMSPALAALLLTALSYHWLFAGTTLGFLLSAALVGLAAVPPRAAGERERSFAERVTRGARIYLATPRLRGLLALTLSAASVGAFVIVNTVVIVRAGHGGSEIDVTWAMAAFGGGSMLAALAMPRLLGLVGERRMMTAAAFLLALGALGFAGLLFASGRAAWPVFLAAWFAGGLLYSVIVTPSGRLLRRSARAGDRPAVFAAHFALSHACWLVTYPLAGWAGEAAGLAVALALLGALALAGAALAARSWPAEDRAELSHAHPDLPPGHPHLARHGGGRTHAHVYVIDDEHRVWPSQG